MIKKYLGRGLVVLLVVLLVGYGIIIASLQPSEQGSKISVDEVMSRVTTGQVSSLTLEDEDSRIVGTTTDGSSFYADLPKDGSVTGSIVSELGSAPKGSSRSKVHLVVDQQSGKSALRFVAQFLVPLLILATLFALFFHLMSGGGGGDAFSGFGRILGAGRRKPAKVVTFADLAGADEAITELAELRDYLADPSRFAAMGARAPKGVLLVGPPGTGKTLLAKALAGEANASFFAISGAEFVESLVGVGAARVRDLFAQARKAPPSIVFIDELDAVGRMRGAGVGQGNDEREQTLNQLLVEMDGFGAALGIIVVGATNRPDILDAALLRPGRFDRQVVVDVPDVHGREKILELYVRGKNLDPRVDLAAIARESPGFAGAELANMVNEAALLAVRAGRSAITQHDLEEAIGRVVAGPERRSHVLTEGEKWTIANHEAGHAVVARALNQVTGHQKLSIVARGRTLGHASNYGKTELLLRMRSQIVDTITVLLAGTACEQLVYGETSTGSDADLEHATGLARSMVCSHGMSGALGRVMLQKGGEVFLGRDLGSQLHTSPATLEKIDHEVQSVLTLAERRASDILVRNRAVLESIVARLMTEETLSGPELDGYLAEVQPHVEVAVS